METWLIGVGLVVFLVLMFQRRFWMVAFGAGSVASCLALMTSVVHFQFIVAIGYLFLMMVCWKIASAMAGSYSPLKNEIEREVNLSSAKGDRPDWSPH